MKKYGFLFGAGAEIVYNLPNGGKFALDIFRRDTNKAKELFKEMRQNVNDKTSYASNWLPKDYLSKNISTCYYSRDRKRVVNPLSD